MNVHAGILNPTRSVRRWVGAAAGQSAAGLGDRGGHGGQGPHEADQKTGCCLRLISLSGLRPSCAADHRPASRAPHHQKARRAGQQLLLRVLPPLDSQGDQLAQRCGVQPPCAHRAVPILDVTRFVRRAGGCRRWAIRKWAGGLRWSWWSWWSSPPGRGQGERPGQVALAQQAKARRLPLSLRPSFSVEVHRSEPGAIIISSSGPAAGSTACPGRGMVTELKEPACVAARPNIFAGSPTVMWR